jgi:hypothetical protein
MPQMDAAPKFLDFSALSSRNISPFAVSSPRETASGKQGNLAKRGKGRCSQSPFALFSSSSPG